MVKPRALIAGAIAAGLTFLATAASAQDAPETPPKRDDAADAGPPEKAETPDKAEKGDKGEKGEKGDKADKPEGPPWKPVDGSGADSPKRAMPDYDGRGAPPTTAGDVALWVPRVILSPIYFVTEFVIRRPIGWFLTTAEKNQWPAAIKNFFTFGPDKKAGVVPTAFLDFGFRPSFGLYAFWDDLLGKGNHLRLHGTTFGKDWLQGAVADSIPLGKDGSVDLRVDGIHRPDFVFYGLGPLATQKEKTRYGADKLQARPVFEMTWWRSSRILTEAGVRRVDFRDDACCGDPSLETAIRDGWHVAPPAYRTGYTNVYQRGELTVDTREERPKNQSGFRLELEVEHGSNVRESASNWIRYGGTVGGFVDIKNNRTLSLAVTTLFVDPISRGAVIPFTEQIVLGGSGPMRGYLYGRLVDRSAAVATLKYRYPIWAFLDGTVQVATGNVFGPQLENFKTKLLRLSGAMGVESIGSPDHTFEFLVGFGTETISQSLDVTSFRLLFGTNRGF